MSLCNSIKSSFVDAVIGLIDAPYTVSEGNGSALLLVGLIEGLNSIQGDVIMTLSIKLMTQLLLVCLISNLWSWCEFIDS